MFSWFKFDTQKELQQQQQPTKNVQGEKSSIITSKVSPTVKSTSVNVIIDEVVNNFNFPKNDSSICLEPESFISNEPLRSASISLSIELAKKTSMSSLDSNKTKPIPFAQKPDTITPHSSLPKSMAIQKKQRPPSSIASNSSNSLLQRMAHSPKASAATFPTSVSANGNAYYSKQEEEHENIRSAAIESLTKRIPSSSPTTNSDLEDDDEDDEEDINDTPATTTTSLDNDYFDNQKNQLQVLDKQQQIIDVTEQEETLVSPTLSTCENKISSSKQDKGGFWSWIGFSSYSEASVEQKESHNATRSAENQKLQIITQQKTDISETHQETIVETQQITTSDAQQETIISSEITKKQPILEKNTTSSWTSYFYSSKSSTTIPIQDDVKKISTAPAPVPPPAKVKRTSSLPTPDTVKPPISTQTLRLSASTSSFHPRKKNEVLPPFESQFIPTEIPEMVTPTTNNNIITKAIDAINSILIQPPPDQPEDNSNWIAKRMKAKFSNFVQDMKSSDPKTIIDKRIVVVGVHGWFPMKLVRSMIGEPTGTSIKFCEQMASGVKLYFQTEHGVTLSNDAITMVPLEGEGKVEDRVNQLYTKLIENSVWLEAVSSADVILWATHSQGTPVSIMLLQRLLERGHIHIIRQSVCLLAMAGISHGPFPSLKGSLIVKYFEADAARELFEFMDSNSPISLKFRQSLAYILKCGVKAVLTGSMQDQVVPLYSAIMSSINHPNILRSIYIDGHIYSQDDFLINLIVFALRLRNTGLHDYDLLTYLSEVLAGSLYALEGGHSTIYEELEVYMTAVRYTFETAPFGKYIRTFPSSKNQISPTRPTTLNSKKSSGSSSSLLNIKEIEATMEPFLAKQQQNPFYLPWAMRGICSDPLILADEVLKDDLSKLLTLFEQWNPASARLRELKFRLDPIKTIKIFT